MNDSCLRLHFTKGLGNLSFGKLMGQFKNADEALWASESEWQSLRIRSTVYREAKQHTYDRQLKEINQWLEQSDNHRVVCYDDPTYPSHFKHLPDPPSVLYLRGNSALLNHRSIAIVGSRHATPLGLKTAQEFAFQLAKFGLSICSGLALGIDGAAHLGALAAGGKTVAFLGSGVDTIYPKQHQNLAMSMVSQNGLLVSEFPLGSPPIGGNFPPRNRLICGLSQEGVLVVESKIKGGSMITARLAAEQGREVFCIPGSIQTPLSEGCHCLIQQGAKLVYRVDQIIEDMGRAVLDDVQSESPQWSDSEKQLLGVMQFEMLRLDEIVELSGLSFKHVQQLLLDLELKYAVKSLSGNRWQRLL